MATSWDKLSHTPANLADWRLQRGKNDAKVLPERGARRSISSTRGHNSAGMTVPGPRDSSSSVERHAGAVRTSLRTRDGEPISHAHPFWNDPEDNLRTARGVIFGIGIGLAMYGIGALIVLAFWR